MERKSLAELIIEEGLVSEERIQKALRAHEATGRRHRFGDFLVRSGIISDWDCIRVLGRQFSMDVVSLSEVQPEEEALRIVGRALAARLGALPIMVSNGILTAAVSDPLDFTVTKVLASECRLRVRTVLATSKEIRMAIARSFDVIESKAAEESEVGPKAAPVVRIETEPTGQGAAGEMVMRLLRRALSEGYTSLIFDPMKDGLRVRCRRAGLLETVGMLPSEKAPGIMAALRSKVGLNPAPSPTPRESRASVLVAGDSVQVDLALLPTRMGERALLTLQGPPEKPLSLEELPMTRSNLALMDQLLSAPGGGFVVLTGLPGEELRTLLGAVCLTLHPDRQVVALVEEGRNSVIEGVLHISVRAGAGGMSYAQAVGAAMRQEPDALLVSDLRDPQTASLLFDAALSGMLVVVGMQTATPAQAFERLLQMGIDEVALARAVSGISVQRWTQRICEYCREKVQPSNQEISALNLEDYAQSVEFFRGRGCEMCDGQGFNGQLSLHAVSALTEEDKRQIMRGEHPWDLFTRLQEAMAYEIAAKALGGYSSASHVVGTLGSL